MIKFGTGGWRAVIGDGFTKANIQLLVQGLCDKIIASGVQHKPVIIGYDRRFLSDIGAKWAAEVFCGNSIGVHFIYRNSPTPLIMFQVKQEKAYYGIAVTASHNPAIYNGVKLFTQGGRDASLEVTDEIVRYIENVKKVHCMPFEKATEEGLLTVIDPFNDYIDEIMGFLDKSAIMKARLRVLLDPMYGVSKTSLQTILLTLRCDVDVINDRHDTLFGGKLPSPSVATLRKLSTMVVEEGYDIGLGTDGDADRLGVIDDQGRFIHPNEILMLLYYYLVKHKGWRGDVIRNIATTHVLDDMAADFGYKCHEVPVGFKHISAKMEETDAVIGGESSGGLTVRGHIFGKDGIFAASLLIEMMAVTKKNLSLILKEIYDRYGYRVMSENSYAFKSEDKERLMKILYKDRLIPDFDVPVERLSYEDGLKVYFKNGGWLVARFSGTEPLLRVFAEMPDQQQADDVCNRMKGFLGI
ncbi:MAG TPA: phosphoglucomutase/phosphomannomutase family protein [Clostridia bacterium]|jgi:phosphomannomutase|nr:phosphoglucomutase/phosphomannomutase family protein [Clostridiaceae bacterium]HOF26074.1 phosphoglucomutase/phosphomannomutase family protein [Clostridia bacterium]HOM34627.1 phosphoglucomutase/phosphomannomutase family protein [Clostridia bacterium]HOR89251.1 phosphoglucomutase/phosphomannomutase family protein [Clostridia bacterium]HOT71365.1 phosphoglucomutase/phosphomannomutase family protein [Clostridia bacterium]